VIERLVVGHLEGRVPVFLKRNDHSKRFLKRCPIEEIGQRLQSVTRNFFFDVHLKVILVVSLKFAT
jgi:hypothetical protein